MSAVASANVILFISLLLVRLSNVIAERGRSAFPSTSTGEHRENMSRLFFCVGRVREQPSGEVLPPDPERAETAGGRDRELEAALRGHRTDSAGDLNRRRRLCFADSGIASSLNSAERSGRWKRSCAFIWRWRPRRTSVAGWARKRLDWLRGEVSAESNRRKSHIEV